MVLIIGVTQKEAGVDIQQSFIVVVARSSKGNGTRTTLPRVIERLAVLQRVAILFRSVQIVEGSSLAGGI